MPLWLSGSPLERTHTLVYIASWQIEEKNEREKREKRENDEFTCKHSEWLMLLFVKRFFFFSLSTMIGHLWEWNGSRSDPTFVELIDEMRIFIDCLTDTRRHFNDDDWRCMSAIVLLTPTVNQFDSSDQLHEEKLEQYDEWERGDRLAVEQHHHANRSSEEDFIAEKETQVRRRCHSRNAFR